MWLMQFSGASILIQVEPLKKIRRYSDSWNGLSYGGFNADTEKVTQKTNATNEI